MNLSLVIEGRLARPDLELLGMAEMVRQAGLIVSAVSIPVIADADTAYGGLANVERTTRAYLQSGVAAIHIEDQASPIRCGHMGGVRLIDAQAMVARLRLAMAARGNGEMLLIGRTDAFKVDGMEEAIRRANLYAETGVDLLFVDGIIRPEDFRRVREAVQGRLMASIVELDAPARTRAAEQEDMRIVSLATPPIANLTRCGFDRSRIVFIPNGVKTDVFHPADPDNPASHPPGWPFGSPTAVTVGKCCKDAFVKTAPRVRKRSNPPLYSARKRVR